MVCFFSRSRGFGLLEVILVFAIVIGAAAVVFTVFQSAKPSADAANEATNLTTMAANVKGAYNGNYSLISASNLIKAKMIPSSMVSGSTIKNQWGTVMLGRVGGGDYRHFQVTYSGIPSEVCSKLISGVAGYFPAGIKVGITDVLDNQGHLLPGQPMAACGAARITKIFFIAG